MDFQGSGSKSLFLERMMLADGQLEHLQGFYGHETPPKLNHQYEQQATVMIDYNEGLEDFVQSPSLK